MTKSMMLVLVLAMAVSATTAASPPAQINYQGVLRDPATGTPMSGAYDAVFRFFSAETGGDEILVDTHMAAANQGLSVANGLFSVALGSGALSDGSGPGTYLGLDAAFRDYASVWLEIEIQGQLLTPRVHVISSPYALNATNFDGRPPASFLDTSSAFQLKNGPIMFNGGLDLGFAIQSVGRGGGLRAYDGDGGQGLSEVGVNDFGIRSYGHYGNGGMPGWFKETQGSAETWLAPGDNGLISFGSNSGGIFRRGTPLAYTDEATLATGGFGVFASGEAAGGLFYSPSGTGQAWLAEGNTGVLGLGTGSGGTFRRGTYSSYTDEALLAFSGYGILAKGDTAGGVFLDRGGTSEARLAWGWYGMEGYGAEAGAVFRRGTPSAYSDEAILATADRGILATGRFMGGEFRTANPARASVKVASDYGPGWGGIGLEAIGSFWGGRFLNSTTPAEVRIAVDNGIGASEAISAWGSSYAGYFARYLVPNSFSEAYLGTAWGVEGIGHAVYSPGGGVFRDSYLGGMVQLGRFDTGIVAYGNGPAGVFRHGSEIGWDNWANLADGSSAIIGSGAKNFVQNHPYDPDAEIVYSALEGDEVGTYTRGSAVFEHGVARVKLSPSFAWVTNPDIGLTATVTPRGTPVRIAVESVTTTELVVRAEAGAQDVAFDYVVQGLRAGFERASVVRPKRDDAPIPPMAEHDAIYASHPEMEQYNALDRFGRMPDAARGGKPADLSRSAALVAAIGVGDMNVAPRKRRSHFTPEQAEEFRRLRPGDSLEEWESKPSELRGGGSPRPGEGPPAPGRPAGSQQDPQPPEHPVAAGINSRPVHPDAGPRTPAGARPVNMIPVAESVESGDVLVNDAVRPGTFVRGRAAGDRGVLGIVAGDPGSRYLTEAPLALAGMVVVCKADATDRPIEANDLLMASSLAGHAMAAGENPRQGTVIGKALEPLDAGTGLIRVLVLVGR